MYGGGSAEDVRTTLEPRVTGFLNSCAHASVSQDFRRILPQLSAKPNVRCTGFKTAQKEPSYTQAGGKEQFQVRAIA